MAPDSATAETRPVRADDGEPVSQDALTALEAIHRRFGDGRSLIARGGRMV